jgi:peroxiredoxin
MKRAALHLLLATLPALAWGQTAPVVKPAADKTLQFNPPGANGNGVIVQVGPANVQPGITVHVGAGAAQPGGGAIIFKRPHVMNGYFLPGATPGQGGSDTDADQSTTPTQPTLYWKNGERLSGDIAGGSAGELKWSSALFDDPLDLKWDALDRIEWPQSLAAPGGQFSVSLRDGSFIYGDLISVGDDVVTIRSPHHGEVALKRSEVLSVRRLQRGDLIFAGPTGNVGWAGLMAQQGGNMIQNPFSFSTDNAIVTGPGGSLKIKIWNRCAVLNFDSLSGISNTASPSDPIDVEFRIHSSRQPAFSFALGGNLYEPLRIETWDDELVAVVKTRFKSIRKLTSSDREIALRVLWDRNKKKCLIYTPNGDLITDWTVPDDVPQPDAGLVLENKGADLTLDYLRVRAWHGQTPGKSDSNQPRIELADGREVPGAIVAGVAGSIKVQSAGQAAPSAFPVDKIDAIVFSSDAPRDAAHDATLVYADGATVQGSIASLSRGEATMTTSFTAAPLPCKLDAPSRLVVYTLAAKEAPPPLAQMDTLTVQSTTLHGKVALTGGNSLAWMPVGGLKPSRPTSSVAATITRALPADTPIPTDAALFYMSSGDVLPGTLHSLDQSGAEFDSDLMSVKKLPATQLDAIQFGVAHLDVKGFNDPGWRISKGDTSVVQIKDDSVTLNPGGAISYPGLMGSSQIQFTYATTGFSSMRLRLFAAGGDGGHSLNILIGNTGAQFICMEEAEAGQFGNQSQTSVKPGTPVKVAIAIHDEQVEILANDVSVQSIPIDRTALAGSGFMIEPASMWGNNVMPVSLTNFSATSSFGSTWLPEVTSDIKTQVLTVPRFEKDDPPKHVLVAANGDVLRGEVEAATDTHLGFRTGLDTLNVPRDRVKAIICLKPPDANTSAAPAQPQGPNPLSLRIQGRAMFGEINLASLVGYLRSQVPDLKLWFNEKESTRAGMIQIGDETVGQALDTICARFDLHYHVSDDGTIILRSVEEFSGVLGSKSYWLKPGAVPDGASAKDTLTAKGITFGHGASADWQPATGVLTMTNTPENQTKLAALVASDFGGSLGSPTAWLVLTNGARFGLAVDDFGPDIIIGHHPVYGTIKVPVAQVCGIRTTAPDPTPTERALDGWRLVNSPEPVIPQPGGNDSAQVGTVAADFSLPLLDGNDFALASGKGSVVVLDFWATWCGPCVRSLPGLVDMVSSFPPDRVKLVGVNQGEAPDQVKHFLQAKNLKLTVALDADQSVARKYGVDAIPHTVIVGPDGKIAWVQTGYDPDGDAAASDVIKHLLDGSAAKPPVTTAPQ